MSPLLIAIILGVVQGLGEFLPISSSAHLIIAPWLFHFEDPGLAFDVALHLGTLAAVLSYFYKDWLELCKNGLASLSKSPSFWNEKEKMFWYLVAATIPGALFGLILEKQAESNLRIPLLIACTMSLLGLLLWYADEKSKKNQSELKDISFKNAMTIGAAQALAIIPGVSRSGITITTALFLGITRQAAARFSFLLSTPIILGAALHSVPKLLKLGISSEEKIAMLVGIVVSAIVGLLSIKYMLIYLQKYSYKVFALYRFFFSIVIVLVYFFIKNKG